MKHGTPLSVAYENGQYREYLILVEELIKNTLCKILLSCEYAFFFFSFFCKPDFHKDENSMISNKKNEWIDFLMILILSSSQMFCVRLAYTDIKFISRWNDHRDRKDMEDT